jgi:outer membrane lipoprotein-sorting protein
VKHNSRISKKALGPRRFGSVLILILAAVSLLPAGCGGGPKAVRELPETYQYTMVFSGSDGSTGVYRVSVKDEKWKIEMTAREAGGEEATTVWIGNEGYVYLYVPEETVAAKYPAESGMSAVAGLLDPFETYYTTYSSDTAIHDDMRASCAADPECQSVAIVGHETISGEESTIFEWVRKGNDTKKIWVATHKGWPLILEFTTGEGTETMEFRDIALNPTIPDSMFDLPKEVQIQEMPLQP